MPSLQIKHPWPYPTLLYHELAYGVRGRGSSGAHNDSGGSSSDSSINWIKSNKQQSSSQKLSLKCHFFQSHCFLMETSVYWSGSIFSDEDNIAVYGRFSPLGFFGKPIVFKWGRTVGTTMLKPEWHLAAGWCGLYFLKFSWLGLVAFLSL